MKLNTAFKRKFAINLYKSTFLKISIYVLHLRVVYAIIN